MKPNKPPKKKRTGIAQAKFGAILNLSGLAFAIAPYFLAVAITLLRGESLNAPGGGMDIILLMIVTLPVGAVVSVIGLVSMVIGIIYTLRVKVPAEPDTNRGEVLGNRAIAFSLIAVPLLLTQPILSFVLGYMILGRGMLVTIVIMGLLVALTSSFAIYYAVKSQKQKLRLYVSIAASLSVVLAAGLGLFWYESFSSVNRA
jgi:hypothetical protein